MKRLIAFWGTVLISWQYADVPGTSTATGFKVALGTTSGQYSRFIDVPGGDKRSVSVANVDTAKVNYAAVASYNSFGAQSVSSPEVAFGGAPPPPFQLKVLPENP